MNILQLAETLHKAGLAVFPCRSNKSPATQKGKSWQDPSQQYPKAIFSLAGLVGVPVPKGVIILDLDTYKGITREKVDNELGEKISWDDALVQTTPRGGQHYAFRVAADWEPSQATPLPGLDVRAAGKGYLATGPKYGSGPNRGLDALGTPDTLPALPDKLRALLSPMQKPSKQKSPKQQPAPIEKEHILNALRCIGLKCGREDWRNIGMGLQDHYHAESGDEEEAFEIFELWSSGKLNPDEKAPQGYSATSLRRQWDSFVPEKGITIGTLFSLALKVGWKPPPTFNIEAAFNNDLIFDPLFGEVMEFGKDPKKTALLDRKISLVKLPTLEKKTLLATLRRQLKDAGLLTPDTRAALAYRPQAIGGYGAKHTPNALNFLATATPDDTLRYAKQVWYYYTGKAWEIRDEDDIKTWIMKELVASEPQASVVEGTYVTIRKLVGVKQAIGEMPSDKLIVQNGILGITTRTLESHDKKYFTTAILGFDYSPEAKCPEWLAFLGQVFEGDAEKIALLQEWLGYLVSGRTSLQKIMMMIGPARSGKGTIGKMIKALVGAESFAGGDLASFADKDYLSDLATKSVVFVGDAEKTIPKNINGTVTTKIRNISGEDTMTLGRKYKKHITCQLPTRITIAANSLPRLFDDSGALFSRQLLLSFNQSFLGREDHRLFRRLSLETGGIANWALGGLDRLIKNDGVFTCPQESLEEMKDAQEISSPLAGFIRDVCTLGGEGFVSSKDLYEAYCTWSGTEDPGVAPLPLRVFVGAFKDATLGKGCRKGMKKVLNSGSRTNSRGFAGLDLEVKKIRNGLYDYQRELYDDKFKNATVN